MQSLILVIRFKKEGRMFTCLFGSEYDIDCSEKISNLHRRFFSPVEAKNKLNKFFFNTVEVLLNRLKKTKNHNQASSTSFFNKT